MAIARPRRDDAAHEVSQIDLSNSNAEIFAALLKTNRSTRIIFKGDRDHPLGIVQAKKDVLNIYGDSLF